MKFHQAAFVIAIAAWIGSAFAKPIDLAARVLKDACAATHYDCKGIKPPHIGFSDVMPSNWYGVYWGSDTVYLRSEFDPAHDIFAYSILLHETVHYLQTQAGHAPPITHAAYACMIEEEAFRVQNAWLIAHGRVDLSVPDWTTRYENCYYLQEATE